MTSVHQLVPVYTQGDAISGATRETRSVLRAMGFQSDIFSGISDGTLQNDSKRAAHLAESVGSGDAVIYHLSLGSPLSDLWAEVPARKILVYHNITPARYFRDVSARVAYDLETGRRALAETAGKADLCIADSSFNLRELEQLGIAAGVVIPPPVDLGRLQPRPAEPGADPTLLFVGRFAPNKRQDVLLKVLRALRDIGPPRARLVLAGGHDDADDYFAALRWSAHQLGVSEFVDIPEGRISDAQLHDYYARASVFICASEHEGFCMPLLEAMSFSLPIVAYSAGAVPETLGGAGLLLDTHDPLVWADAIGHVLSNPGLHTQLVETGKQRLKDFSIANYTESLAKALSTIGITA